MYLGLDLGTSGLKGVLIDEQGRVLGQSSASLVVTTPFSTWSEQDPTSWWQACRDVIADLKKTFDLSLLKGIGLSGQMHGATLLDKKGQVLRPCILWNDGRSQDQCLAMMDEFPELIDKSGNLAMPGFTAPKLRWVKENEPDVFAKTAFVLLPKDYLAYKLTGSISSDYSDASGTLWLNPSARCWDEELLSASSLSKSNMPKLFEGCDVVGRLTEKSSKELGVPQVPLVAGAGDNAAGAIGMGVVNSGQGIISLGTSGVYFAVSDSHKANPRNTVHAFCHALPNRWHQMGVTLSAANCLGWYADLVDESVPKLLERLEQANILETSVVFLPYLNGERTPHNDANASGQFFGLSSNTNQADMVLAILEGVAFSLLDCQEVLIDAGSDVENLSLIGGGARSPLWRQIIANVLGKTLFYREGGEIGPAVGAARLALIGVEYNLGGNIEGLIEQHCYMPDVIVTHNPNLDLAEYYQNKFCTYKSLYQLTKSLNKES
ncbi:xylulokinase [Marinomonas sp. C2222]|uniref:Xylulose kinase n=1 Tax=Marinomonas sargassi TaxID=2984494 RepID=A0ABT2YVK7_9GAMM|nr:xylulokinase [Marinomonas sargassi]MCV2403933.1 xylulokinase [Marinomonas sargassi]